MNTKLCTRCKIEKPISNFYARHIKSKKSSWCKECHIIARDIYRKKDMVENKEKYNAWNRHWRGKNVLKLKNYNLKKFYGITLEEYDAMVIKQNGQCLICNKKKKLFVDHHHLTKKLRGLLCDKCNPGLGFFDDDVNILKSAILYLQQPTEPIGRSK